MEKFDNSVQMAVNEKGNVIGGNELKQVDFMNMFEALEYIGRTDDLVSSADVPATQDISLNVGKYFLVATAKTAEWNPNCKLTGVDDIKVLGYAENVDFAVGADYWGSPTNSSDGYQAGRGHCRTYLYLVKINEPTTLTFSVVYEGKDGSLKRNAVGALAIYKFK